MDGWQGEGGNTGDGYMEHVGLRVLRLCDPTEMRLMSRRCPLPGMPEKNDATQTVFLWAEKICNGMPNMAAVFRQFRPN